MIYLTPYEEIHHPDMTSSRNNKPWTEWRRYEFGNRLLVEGMIYHYDDNDEDFVCICSGNEKRFRSVEDAKTWLDNALVNKGYYLIKEGEEARFEKLLGLLI